MNTNLKFGILITIFVVAISGVLIYFEQTDFSFNNQDNYYQAVEKGAQWFLNNQNDNFIYYEYYPFEKKHSEDQHSLREMGALWSIAKSANYLKNSELKDLANKGFSYFEKHFVYDEENDFIYVNVTEEKIKLGYSAFAILSLLEIDHEKKDYYLEKLANGILYQQQESGEIKTFFYSDRNTGIDYYPGEALIAIMSLYEYDPQDKYLQAVEKAFPYYAQYFRENNNTAFVPWQSRAYYKLYEYTNDPEIGEFIFEMNDYLLTKHDPVNECADFDFSKGIVTAVYIEGMNKAYALAKDVNDEQREKCYKNFIKEGIDYILTLQVRDQQEYELAALGGFFGSKTSVSMRVDRNQHAIMSLMDALEIGVLD